MRVGFHLDICKMLQRKLIIPGDRNAEISELQKQIHNKYFKSFCQIIRQNKAIDFKT